MIGGVEYVIYGRALMTIDNGQDNLTWTAASATATYELLEGEEVMISYLPVSHIVAQVAMGIIVIQDVFDTLLLALDSARFEFTLKMRLNRKMLERPNICYIFEKLSVQFKDVKYDISMCKYHSTRPQPI